VIAAPIEAAIEQQTNRVLDLEIAVADAKADVDRAVEAFQELTRQLGAARIHLDALRTFANGGAEGPIT